MIRSFLLAISCLLLVSHKAFSQNEILENIDFEKAIQDLLPQPEYDIDYNDFYDRLFTLYSSPINLNDAERTDLQSLYILTDEQIASILEYKRKYGSFRTIYELSTIATLDQATINKLKHFIHVGESNQKKFSRPSINELFLRFHSDLEEKRGYTPPDTLNDGSLTSRYQGTHERLYARYLLAKPGNYSLGFTIEKDPGEKITWDPNTKRYGMDYYSVHGMIENISIFNKIILGDFSMDFGQGLIFGSGIRIGKGNEPILTIRKNNYGLKPYRSVFESKDFSGIAATFGHKNFSSTLFYSKVFSDARIVESNIDSLEIYTSNISSVGLHRTPSEISAKHAISNSSFGGNVNIKVFHKKLEVGLNAIHTHYSIPLIPGNEKYRFHQFAGNSNYNMGTYVNFYFKNGHFFNELAISKSRGIAHLTGLIVSLSSTVQASVLYRNYDPNYHSFNGNAFGENNSINNEKGIYWGLKIRPSSRLLLNAYFDYFKFPWLKYQVDAPSGGYDFMTSLNLTLGNNTNIRFQYRNKIKAVNWNTNQDPLLEIVKKNNIRFIVELNHKISPNFDIKSMVQKVATKKKDLQYVGYMISQDVSFKSKKCSLAGRFALFNADDYESRLYTYERDLLYVYSIPSFYNKGVRYYILGKWNMTKYLSIWFKFSQTKYYNIDSIGSGLEKINGSTKSRLSIQMKIKL